MSQKRRLRIRTSVESAMLCVVAPVVLLLVGCGGEGTGKTWAGTIDTLENGVVLVSNPATGVWDSADAWRLVEELRIGSVEGEGPESFSRIAQLRVDQLGRIYVLDRQLQEIRVFEEGGEYVRTIGRPGEGPGEFVAAVGMDFDAAGRLWVVDSRRPYYCVFDSSGTFVATYRREVTVQGYRWGGAFLRSGALYDLTGARVGDDWKSVLARYDTARGFVDTVPLPEHEPEVFEFSFAGRTRVMTTVPFASGLHWKLDSRGYLWTGVSDQYRIYQTGMAGDTVLAIQRDYQPVPVSARERDSALAWVRKAARGAAVDASKIPRHKPAFRRLVVDDAGYLWVVPTTPETVSGTVFDVFDPAGRYLGAMSSAVTIFHPVLVQGNSMYTVTRDELDVPYVVRLRIEGRR